MKKLILPILAIGLLTGCKKDDDNKDDDKYAVPSTYNFKNVSYTGQIDRQDMLQELTAYVKTSHVEGTTVDAQVMKDMFANNNNPFNDADLNASTKNLIGKTFNLDTTYYLNLFDSIAKYSGQAGGANGTAGIVTNGSRSILCDANGLEYAQIIDKGLMGATFYYQATSVYLTDDKIGDAVDNETVVDGKGTDKEHHFDEAFGYFGAPIDFPSNTSGVRFWAKYCNGRNDLVSTNKIMDEFLKGRAAISNKDKSAQNDAVSNIKSYWEKVAAATALHYINSGIDNINDDAERNHALTEALMFIQALKYNVDKTISNTKIEEVLNKIGDNLYNVSLQNLTDARDLLADEFNWTSKKTQF